MDDIQIPQFSELCRRWGGPKLVGSEQIDEMTRIVAYLRHQGSMVSEAADVFDAVQSLREEGELSSHHCVEGIAVSHASEGWWLLFAHGSLEPTASSSSDQPPFALGEPTC